MKWGFLIISILGTRAPINTGKGPSEFLNIYIHVYRVGKTLYLQVWATVKEQFLKQGTFIAKVIFSIKTWWKDMKSVWVKDSSGVGSIEYQIGHRSVNWRLTSVSDYPQHIRFRCMHQNSSSKLITAHLLSKPTLETCLCGKLTCQVNNRKKLETNET